MHKHKLLAFQYLNEAYTYRVKFFFYAREPKEYRIILAEPDWQAPAFGHLAQSLGRPVKGLRVKVLSFYETEWETKALAVINNRSVFEKWDPNYRLNMSELIYFFKTILSILEAFVKKFCIEVIYFSSYSETHTTLYDYFQQRLTSTLLPNVLTIKRGQYAIKTCYYP